MHMAEQTLTTSSSHSLLSHVLRGFKVFPSQILSLHFDEEDCLKEFATIAQVWALVNDKEEVAQFKAKDPQLKYFAQSLTAFRLPEKMQLIYLFSQSINTLKGTSKWTTLFEKVVSQLTPYGLFVFDVFTPEYFDTIGTQRPTLTITDHKIDIVQWKQKAGVFQQNTLSLVQSKDNHYLRKDTSLQFSSVDLATLKKLLSPHFEHVSFVDHKGKKLRKNS